MDAVSLFFLSFFFNDTATTEIYTLSLHDALPISRLGRGGTRGPERIRAPLSQRTIGRHADARVAGPGQRHAHRSEEHTSELQSQSNLVCRLLLEKKKKTKRHETLKNSTQTTLQRR